MWGGWSAVSVADSLARTGLPTPTTLTELPLTLTGRSTGTWIPIPERTPGLLGVVLGAGVARCRVEQPGNAHGVPAGVHRNAHRS